MEEVKEALGAKLLSGAADVKFSGVSTDTRKLKEGDLFFALQGENFDGHDFVDRALEQGAGGVVVSKIVSSRPVSSKQCIFEVEDVLNALQGFASWHLKQMEVPVVAVTGSNGKTTTKDMIAAALSSSLKVHKTEGNLNNEIGLPLTLLGLKPTHEVVIVEMGMRGLGQIAQLCEIAPPDIGVVTSITGTHYELLGSMENIAKAKAELIEALKAEGYAILNGDNEWCRRIAVRTKAGVSFFGLNGGVEFKPTSVSFSARRGTYFTLKFGRERQKFFIPLLGEHNVRNALAAIAVSVKLGLTPKAIAEGLAEVTLSGMRQEQVVGRQQILILDDTYNANADSMIASLRVLKRLPGKRKVAVLGDMLELGEISSEKHRQVGQEASGLNIDILITVGDLAEDIHRGAVEAGFPKDRAYHTLSLEDTKVILDEKLKPRDAVLVKASRGMHLEKVVEYLQVEK